MRKILESCPNDMHGELQSKILLSCISNASTWEKTNWYNTLKNRHRSVDVHVLARVRKNGILSKHKQTCNTRAFAKYTGTHRNMWHQEPLARLRSWHPPIPRPDRKYAKIGIPLKSMFSNQTVCSDSYICLQIRWAQILAYMYVQYM